MKLKEILQESWPGRNRNRIYQLLIDIKRFEKNERVEISGTRPLRDGDLPDAPRDLELSNKIAKLL
jgi:hypothetical protein